MNRRKWLQWQNVIIVGVPATAAACVLLYAFLPRILAAVFG